jgi:SOS-response transcriptional repressor LexA
MTPGDRAFLDAHQRLTARGVAPSNSQLQAELGLRSKSGVARRVDRLERLGLVHRRPGQARSLRLLATDIAPPPVARMADALADAAALAWNEDGRPLGREEIAAVLAFEWAQARGGER